MLWQIVLIPYLYWTLNNFRYIIRTEIIRSYKNFIFNVMKNKLFSVVVASFYITTDTGHVAENLSIFIKLCTWVFCLFVFKEQEQEVLLAITGHGYEDPSAFALKVNQHWASLSVWWNCPSPREKCMTPLNTFSTSCSGSKARSGGILTPSGY